MVRRNSRERIVTTLRWVLVVIGVMLIIPTVASSRRQKKIKAIAPDTASLVLKLQDANQSRKMSSSIYPVKIQIQGRAVQVQSDHNQILPIYTRSGAFYMAARLNKGLNWINGLPRGNYFINNRPVTVN